MIIDGVSLLLGFSLGAFLSGLFFAGLAWGMQIALRSSRPVAILLLSSIFRVSLLLAAGFWVVAACGNAWPGIGFALAFFLVRLLATFWAHSASASTTSQKETG